jgi:hypothetical protein
MQLRGACPQAGAKIIAFQNIGIKAPIQYSQVVYNQILNVVVLLHPVGERRVGADSLYVRTAYKQLCDNLDF